MTSTTRICQATGPYAPPLSDCQAALASVSQAHPKYLFSGSRDAACSVVGKSGRCALSMCAFPGNAVQTSKYTDAVNGILNTCKGLPQDHSNGTVTGGYDIIQGTNFTFGVFGTDTPTSHFCSTNPSISAMTADCSRLVDGLDQTAFFKQSSTSGCTTIKTIGTCSTNLCAPMGTQVSGLEYWASISNILGWCASAGKPYISGTQIMDSSFNVSIYATASSSRQPGPIDGALACDKDNAVSTKADCGALAKAIKTKYPSVIKQPQRASACSVVARSGTCQADFCADTGASIATTDFLNALKNITDNCQAGTAAVGVKIGGQVRLQNSSVVISGVEPAQNIVCNTAANNSPTTSDCQKVMDGLDKSKIYGHVHDPCTVVGTAGKCKLNFCSPPNTTFTGQQLFDAATTIQYNCSKKMASDTYSSGIYQVNPYTNISLFDPPGTPGKTDYTTQEIRDLFTNSDYVKPKPDSCFFYVSYFREKAVAEVDARNEHALDGRWLTLYDFYRLKGQDGFPFDNTIDPFLSYYNKGMERDWFKITSRAYAEVCTGIVYLMWDTKAPLSGKDEQGNPWTSIWLTDELGAYRDGVAKWTGIMRTDPETGDDSPYTGPMQKRGLAASARFGDALTNANATASVRRAFDSKLAKRDKYGSCSDDYPSCDFKEDRAFESPNIEGTAFIRADTGWVPGQCGFHIIQYQKPDPSKDSYRYVIQLKDAERTVIASGDYTLPTGQSATTNSGMPYGVTIKAGAVDADPVYWSYGSFTSDTGQATCSQGAYDSGSRNIDCGFTCI